MTEKACTKCGVTKPLEGFYLMKARGTYRGECKECRKADQAKRLYKNRDPAKKAEYKRRVGQVSETIPYVPRAETLAFARGRDGAKHSAHVAAWKMHSHNVRWCAAIAALHDAHVRLFRSSGISFRRRYRTDPEYALMQRLRMQVRKKSRLYPRLGDLIRGALGRSGNSGTVSEVCGYSIADLKAHLERQFDCGMTWDAFHRGEIHIDHVKPQRLFDLSTLEGVRECWSLTNLQPLWAGDNIRKGGSYAEEMA